MSVPRSAIIVPNSPSATASIAWSPNLLASHRSKAVGVPPRWMWPRTTARASAPVRLSISLAIRSPMPPRRTWPKASFSPETSVMSPPSCGTAPSETTRIGE